MINIKKVNIELLLSLLFSFLVFWVVLSDTKVIWNHMQFINSLWSFEVGSTWGRQLALTQNIVILAMVGLVVFIVVMRIRQFRANR